MLDHALSYARLGWYVFPVWGLRDGKCACGKPGCNDTAKHPVTVNGFNGATTDESQIRMWWTSVPDASIGVAMEKSGLCALDIDLYHKDDAKFEALVKQYGDLPTTVVGKSGSGEGYHFIFKSPGFPVRGVLQGIVVRAKAYVIVAPSSHASGNFYQWVYSPDTTPVAEFPDTWKDALRKTAEVGQVGIPAVEPAWLAAIPQDKRIADMRAHLEREPGEIKGVSEAGTTFNVVRSATRMYAVRDPEIVLASVMEIYDPKCQPPWRDRMGRHVWSAYERAHSPEWGAAYRGGEQRLEDLGLADAPVEIIHHMPAPAVEKIPAEPPTDLKLRSELEGFASGRASRFKYDRTLIRMMLKGGEHLGDDVEGAALALVKHSPEGTTDDQLVPFLASCFIPDELARILIAKARTSLAPKVVGDVAGSLDDLPPPTDDDELMARLPRDPERGTVINRPDVVAYILRWSEATRNRLQFNELTKEICVKGGPFSDTPSNCLATEIVNWLSSKWGLVVTEQFTKPQIALIARKFGAFDPVKEYLEKLKWDGVPRLDTWLMTYCGADDTNYNRRVGAMWMISAVARGLRPGSKVDTVLILEGGQGVKKSTTFDVLGGEWFSGTPLVLGNKDSYMLASSTWIVELAELSSLRIGEVEAHKAFLSSRTDRFRPPYGAVVEEFDRHCVFGGSTNEREYLLDNTGNRRYWAVPVTKCDAPRLREDRDQLWAEAVYRYKSAELNPDRAHPECPGERWWFELDEQVEADEVARARRAEDPWVSMIHSWMHRQNLPGPGITPVKTQWTLAEIAKGALDLQISELQRHQRHLMRALREAGLEWVDLPPDEFGHVQRVWQRVGVVVHDASQATSVPAEPTDRPGSN